MEYANFTTYEDPEHPVFMIGRTYQMATPGFFTGKQLAERGACQMQVLLIDEQNRDVFDVIGSFIGGDGEMDFMEVLVESVQKLSISQDGELEYTPYALREETSLSIASQNVLTVDTEVSAPRGLIQDRAEQFAKEVITNHLKG